VVRSAVKDRPTSQPDDAAALRQLHEARARAELAAADLMCPGSDAVASRGALLGGVALVKGLPGPAEASGGAALSGPDGDAALKALEALGWSADQLFCVLSRPEPGADPSCCSARLGAVLEAVDPRVIVALDRVAADDVGAAFGTSLHSDAAPVTVLGRTLVAVDDLEASLADDKRKRRVWEQFKAAKPPGPIY